MSVSEDLKWKKTKVLDDGFVCLVDMMGNDDCIAEAARVSYGTGTRSVSDNRTLIRYLMRHKHTSPFEMAELKFLVRVPMDCWRQWVRHRTASINEYSTRYSIAIDSCYTIEPNEWRMQSSTNRQGSDGHISSNTADRLSRNQRDFIAQAQEVYSDRIAAGVAREQARKDLPLSTYTEAYWKIDLHNLLHFIELRNSSKAQKEIRDYAQAIGEITSKLFPLVWEAFNDYRMNSISLTAIDAIIIKNIAELYKNGCNVFQISAALDDLFIQHGVTNSRERSECVEKVRKLGLLSEA